jgi:hypothetical protein
LVWSPRVFTLDRFGAGAEPATDPFPLTAAFGAADPDTLLDELRTTIELPPATAAAEPQVRLVQHERQALCHPITSACALSCRSGELSGQVLTLPQREGSRRMSSCSTSETSLDSAVCRFERCGIARSSTSSGWRRWIRTPAIASMKHIISLGFTGWSR